jgi:hypothetical protein
MYFLEDIPSLDPRFDFDLVAEALAPVIKESRSGAIILGLHGDWGAGKTTLMNALRRKVAPEPAAGDPSWHISIDFNAWKYQDREALWRALILSVIGRLRQEAETRKWEIEKKTIGELETALYRAFDVKETGPWKVNWRVLITEILRAALAIIHLDIVADAIREAGGFFGKLFFPKKSDDKGGKGEKKESGIDVKELTGILERTEVTRHVDQVQSIEQFLKGFQDLVKCITDKGLSLFIFVDDLDRCLPEDALQVFEAIKLFLDAPGCAYVVALDRDVIRKGLAVRYGKPGEYSKGQSLIDPDRYIEKTISLSFDLPRLGRADVISLIDDAKLARPLSEKQKHLIFEALGPNPRRVKRFMNALAVQLNLAAVTKEKQGKEAEKERGPVPEWLLQPQDDDYLFDGFIKVLLLSYHNPGLATLLSKDFDMLNRVYGIANDYVREMKHNAGKARAELVQRLKTEPPLIAALEDNEEFLRLLTIEPTLTNNAKSLATIGSWFRGDEPNVAPGVG